MKPKMLIADAADFLGVSQQRVHAILKEKNLTTEKAHGRVFFGHDVSRKLFGITQGPTSAARVIAVQVVKGGPGKTSIVKNLGVRLSLYGRRVLLIDLDQQGNLTNDFIDNADDIPVMYDILDPKEPQAVADSIQHIMPGLDILPSRLENSALDNLIVAEKYPLDLVFSEIINPLRPNYDFILIDCPPALSQTTAAAALASDSILIPVAPEKYCMAGLKMTVQELKKIESRYKRKLPFQIVVNKYESEKLLSKETLGKLVTIEAFIDRIMGQVIRLSEEIPKSAASRSTIFDALRPSRASEDFDKLAREMIAPVVAASQAVEASAPSPRLAQSRQAESQV